MSAFLPRRGELGSCSSPAWDQWPCLLPLPRNSKQEEALVDLAGTLGYEDTSLPAAPRLLPLLISVALVEGYVVSDSL